MSQNTSSIGQWRKSKGCVICRTLKNTKQAFNDFNICINLDERYVNAYVERAKLFFASGQPAKGL